MWCLDSCDEPVIQFSQESDLVGTHPVGSYPCEVPVFRVEEAGESGDVLLGPGQGTRDDHDDEVDGGDDQDDQLDGGDDAHLGGAVGAVGDSKSPILSSPSSPTTSLTWAMLTSATAKDLADQQVPTMIVFLTDNDYILLAKTCFGFTRQMTLSGQLHILRIGSNLEGNVCKQMFVTNFFSHMRDPGQSWSLGCPLAHLKYFLQLSGFGSSSPSLVQDALWAGSTGIRIAAPF